MAEAAIDGDTKKGRAEPACPLYIQKLFFILNDLPYLYNCLLVPHLRATRVYYVYAGKWGVAGNALSQFPLMGAA